MSTRSATRSMTPRFGIDTSVLVRLLTGEPPTEFARAFNALRQRIESEDALILASNQVIGEAYVAVQHHYGVSRADARNALLEVLQSGVVAPQNGREVLAAFETTGQPGLLDRLIVDDCNRGGLEVLTLDRRMAGLPGARLL